MPNNKSLIIITILAVVVLMTVSFSLQPVYAHPGRTASDGCHYCRTNCDKWGVPWNERHCHIVPTTGSITCDDNIWTFLAPGKQSCKYSFSDFITGWGLVYLVGGVVLYSYYKKDKND